MFILSTDEGALVNLDNVSQIYATATSVKASLVGSTLDVTLKLCKNKQDAVEALSRITDKIRKGTREGVLYILCDSDEEV